MNRIAYFPYLKLGRYSNLSYVCNTDMRYVQFDIYTYTDIINEFENVATYPNEIFVSAFSFAIRSLIFTERTRAYIMFHW